jgi:GTPase
VEASKIVAATEGTIIITFDHIGLVVFTEEQIIIAISKVKLDLKITVIVLLATKNYVFNQLHPKVAKE